MINYICKLTMDKLIHNNLIKEEELEVYNYGLEILLATIFKLIGLLLIGIIGGIIKETIVFILFFGSLRIQAGGHHAKSILNCFIGTLVLLLCAIGLVKILPPQYQIYYILISSIISTFLIYLYAPLGSENKPLDKDEKVKYKKRSLITVILGSLIILVLSYMNPKFTYLGTVALIGFCSESLTLIHIDKESNRN